MLKSALSLTLAVGAVAMVGCKDDTKTEQAAPTTMPSAMPAPAPVEVTPPAVPAVPAVPAAPTTAPSTAAVDPSIQALMDKAVADVEAKNWSAAEADLKQLEDLKDKLPAGWLDKVKSMEAAVQAGKLTSGGGVTIPGLSK
jgi:hypothetical protein